MSIKSEIDRITGNIAKAYVAAAEKGGVLPESQNSENLADTITGIPTGSPSASDEYGGTRPLDWLPVPEPADDEIYLLFHIPDGAGELLAFTVTCTGSYRVEMGTAEGGAFVPFRQSDIADGGTFEAELFSEDYGNLTGTGMRQALIRISGTDILSWEPAMHSRKTAPVDFADWNIVEIKCRLPGGTAVRCCKNISAAYVASLTKLRYFTWRGTNRMTDASYMFYQCCSLTAVLELDTSGVENMSHIFNYCVSLTTAPKLNISSGAANTAYMFYHCYSLAAALDLYTLQTVSFATAFKYCHALSAVTFQPYKTDWAGCNVSFADSSLGHKALVRLFNSLPAITKTRTLVISGNPGVLELTDEEKAVAENKNWYLI